ncbi:hypothetical protein [Exiguobacterium sp. S22-S28]|uniref:hypothetical protein n=1 Tax=Exiguobacterium sp. S22-S28 TaxID=3342768 RepID=UPI00372D3777
MKAGFVIKQTFDVYSDQGHYVEIGFPDVGTEVELEEHVSLSIGTEMALFTVEDLESLRDVLDATITLKKNMLI